MHPTTAHGHHYRRVTGHDREYLPPTGKHQLLPLYDVLTRLVGVRRVHRRLVEAAALRPEHRMLEIGCGTGNLTLLAKATQPEAVVVGLDPDFAALARARRKAQRRKLDVQWDVGSAADLPYPDDSVDRVLSAFMLHHLPGEQERTLAEVRRVLRPGGELHLVDFDSGHAHGPLLRRAQQNPHTQFRSGEGIAGMLRAAGFAEVTATTSHVRFLGAVTAFRAG